MTNPTPADAIKLPAPIPGAGLIPILIGNAAFSFFSGCSLIVAHSWLQDVFPAAPVFLFPVLGVGLILFALDIFYQLNKSEISIAKVRYFTYSDLAWVAGSAAALIFIDGLMPIGRILIWATAAMVFLFSVLQGWHLLSSKTNPSH